MAKQNISSQSDRGVDKSAQRPSCFSSFSSTSSITFKIRHSVVAFQEKIRSLDSRRIQQKHQQAAVPCSKLLTLPFEIRLMIYDYVFTARDATYSDIRLISSQNIYPNVFWNAKMPRGYYIKGHPCIGEEMLEFTRASSGLAALNTEGIAIGKRHEDVDILYQEAQLGVMALMLTCRALYHEMLDIFYAHRTWQFNDLDTLVIAAEHIPMRHFNNIRSLYLNASHLPRYADFTGYIWGLPREYQQRFRHLAPPSRSLISRVSRAIDTRLVDTGDIRKWQAVCDTIARMESLKKLRITLCEQAFIVVLESRRPSVQITKESFVFAPLTGIGKGRDLEVFEVRVDWPVGDDDAWSEEAEKGFNLIRLAGESHPGLQ